MCRRLNNRARRDVGAGARASGRAGYRWLELVEARGDEREMGRRVGVKKRKASGPRHAVPAGRQSVRHTSG